MKRQNLVLGVAIGVLIALPGGGGTAFAGITITVAEVGSDVVTTGSGTLDYSLWTNLFTQELRPQINPGGWLFVGETADADVYDSPVNFNGPADIGPGEFRFADAGTGDFFGLQWDPNIQFLVVPEGYVSGDPLSESTATYTGHTFASLGVEKGSYTWTWDTDDGRGDFFTINVIPAPGACALLGVAGLVSRRRRRA